jgi:type IV pilus assembly protein PilW
MIGHRRALPEQRSAPQRRQRGMSIIEMLVGVVVGLLVVAGASKLMIDSFGENRRLLLETRVNQDLRAAADLIARDIRRAGYWTNAGSGVFSAAGATATANPYIGVVVSSTTPAQGSVVTHSDSVGYQFARDTNNEVDFPELAGFRLTDDGVLEFRNDPADDTERWLPMTDPKVVLVTNLTITPLATPRQVELYTYCACLVKLTCTAADFQAGGTYYEPTNPSIPRRPTLTIREYGIVLAGRSTADATVQREVRETVRVRNDALSGRCPAV